MMLPPRRAPGSLRRALVGRDAELARLLALRRRAGEGHGAVVLLAGEAGIGKSRLLNAFRETLSGGRAAFGEARCSPYSQRPFGALRDALVDVLRKLPQGHEVEGALRRLADELSFESSAPDRRESDRTGRRFKAIAETLTRLSDRRTLVLTIDDLHWADRATLAFLAHAAESVEQRRMLIVATYRSDDVQIDAAALGDFGALLGRSGVEHLALAPLDRAAMRALLQAHPDAAAVEAPVLADIVRRSEGNPFFAEELVKSAAVEGLTTGEQLPLSLRGAIVSRLERLPPEDRLGLSQASVLGRRFSSDDLARLLARPKVAILESLRRARALNFVVEDATVRDGYAFRHALTQEAIYGELLREEVRPLHERIGRELEARPDRDTVLLDLAHHWWHAGDLSRAAAYGEAGGDRAAALGAYGDAATLYERVLSIAGGDDERRARLEHKLGRAYGALGHPTQGLPHLRSADRLWRRLGRAGETARNAEHLGIQTYNAGDVRGAVAEFRAGLAAAEGAVEREVLDRLRARVAYTTVAALELRPALDVIADVPLNGDPLTASLCRLVRLKSFAMEAERDAWLAEIEPALGAAAGVPDGNRMLALTHGNVGIDATALGEGALGRLHLEQALAMRKTASAEFDATLYRGAMALERVLAGEYASAAALCESAGAEAGDAYTSRLHLSSAQLAVAIFTGDDVGLTRRIDEDVLELGLARGMNVAAAIVGGWYAWGLAIAGRRAEAADWLRRMAPLVTATHRFTFVFAAAAQFGDAADVAALRPLLESAAARPADRVARALFPLYDALAAERGLLPAPPPSAVRDAGARFAELQWPWFAARCYEAAQDRRRALTIFRRIGAFRDLHRLERKRAEAPAARVLSPRERQIADLVARAYSNDAIAQELGIGKRTVETHVSSVLEKLGLQSRAQLGLMFSESRASDVTG